MKVLWFENPPLRSPSAVPALGVGLCVNTILLLMVYVLMEKFPDPSDDLLAQARQTVLFWYSCLVIAPAVMYGVSAAAWTGWSWWRVPLATAAGCTLGWCANVLLLSFWANHSKWVSESSLQWGGPATTAMILYFIASMLALLALWSTLFSRSRVVV